MQIINGSHQPITFSPFLSIFFPPTYLLLFHLFALLTIVIHEIYNTGTSAASHSSKENRSILQPTNNISVACWHGKSFVSRMSEFSKHIHNTVNNHLNSHSICCSNRSSCPRLLLPLAMPSMSAACHWPWPPEGRHWNRVRRDSPHAAAGPSPAAASC